MMSCAARVTSQQVRVTVVLRVRAPISRNFCCTIRIIMTNFLDLLMKLPARAR